MARVRTFKEFLRGRISMLMNVNKYLVRKRSKREIKKGSDETGWGWG